MKTFQIALVLGFVAGMLAIVLNITAAEPLPQCSSLPDADDWQRISVKDGVWDIDGVKCLRDNLRNKS